MALLDTDMISIHQRRDAAEHTLLQDRIDQSGEVIYVCISSFEEQMRGWLAYASKTKTAEHYIFATEKMHELLKYFNKMPMLLFDHNASSHFQALRKQFRRIGTMDLRIAAIALAHNSTLVTRNVRDFAGIPSLRVEDWTKVSRRGSYRDDSRAA